MCSFVPSVMLFFPQHSHPLTFIRLNYHLSDAGNETTDEIVQIYNRLQRKTVHNRSSSGNDKTSSLKIISWRCLCVNPCSVMRLCVFICKILDKRTQHVQHKSAFFTVWLTDSQLGLNEGIRKWKSVSGTEETERKLEVCWRKPANDQVSLTDSVAIVTDSELYWPPFV